MPSVKDIVATAEALLSNRFGGTQRVTETEELSGSGNAVVVRCRLAASPFVEQRSVVVKYLPITDRSLDDAALVREVVAYQFTTSLGEDARPGPVLLAYDIDKRIIVITDSGDGDTFADLLAIGNEEQRIQILRNLGQALGRMHAATANREADFQTLRSRMSRKHPHAAAINQLRTLSQVYAISQGVPLLRAAGIEVPETVARVASESLKRLRGGRRAFTPFDLAPDNIIVADRTQFLDYEWADFRDVSFDLASVIAGFPQFLSARPISDEEADVFIESWIREIHSTWPQISDNADLQEALASALLGLALQAISSMHYGSSHNLVQAVAESQGEHLAEYAPEDMTAVADLVAPAGSCYDAGLLLMRRDLFETYDALARYAERIAGSYAADFAVVAVFARQLATRLDDRTIAE